MSPAVSISGESLHRRKPFEPASLLWKFIRSLALLKLRADPILPSSKFLLIFFIGRLVPPLFKYMTIPFGVLVEMEDELAMN